MGGTKKSFADEIAELLTPAPEPERDPEREDLEEVAVLEASDDEILQLDKKGSKGKEKPRLRGSIDLVEGVYTGKRSTREGFFGKDDEETTGQMHISTSQDLEKTSDEEDQDAAGEVSSGEEDNSLEDLGGSLPFKSAAYNDMNGIYSEADILEKEMMAVQEAEAEVVEEMKDRAVKEYRKSVCVKNQKRLWNAALEARIMMQKVVQGANVLPPAGMHPFLRDVDPALSKEMEAVSMDARRTLGDICAVLDALAENNPEISSSRKKRKFQVDKSVDQCWKAIEDRYQSFIPYRDLSLDRWQRKTMLSSGATPSLKVLNQGISKQVELLMKDKDKIAARSRVPMNQFKGLCQLEIAQTSDSENSDEENGNPTLTPGGELLGAPDTYQDGEFYQALLNEFLEGTSDFATQKIHKEPKNRKIVDRRASKGRKIRYHVHDKLVNFMTPNDTDIPEYASRIFANLFGHKRSTVE